MFSKGLALLIVFAVWVSSELGAVAASDGDQTDIANLLGAGRFYDEGILGQGARAAVVEGGLIWNGDVSTSHVTEYFSHENTWRADFGDERDLWDRHATWSGSLLGGRGSTLERVGIAPMVDLVSGATATRWVGTAYTSSWSQTATTVNAAYRYFFETSPVDVISSSWGFTDSAASSVVMIGLDALAYENSTTLLVAASGNRGFSGNSVVAPASGMNSLSVGGLSYEDGRYDERWASSGRGLSDYYDPINGVVRSVRASVDLLAPAQNLSALRYGGLTGGNNISLSGSVESATRDSNGLFGTSFSTPLVAGAAALMVSLSREQMAGNEESRDARVIKAALINSADKLAGWTAAEGFENGVLTTRQGLDAEQGAGRINMDRAYEQFAPGVGVQAGLSGDRVLLESVYTSGWDLATAGVGDSSFYELDAIIQSGSRLVGSLVWYRERRFVGGVAEDLKQANFDLFLWADAAGDGLYELVAASVSEYNTVEHLDVVLDEVGRYRFEVRYDGDTFRSIGASDGESFAFAWDLQAVPEPRVAALLFGMVAFSAVLVRRR